MGFFNFIKKPEGYNKLEGYCELYRFSIQQGATGIKNPGNGELGLMYRDCKSQLEEFLKGKESLFPSQLANALKFKKHQAQAFLNDLNKYGARKSNYPPIPYWAAGRRFTLHSGGNVRRTGVYRVLAGEIVIPVRFRRGLGHKRIVDLIAKRCGGSIPRKVKLGKTRGGRITKNGPIILRKGDVVISRGQRKGLTFGQIVNIIYAY